MVEIELVDDLGGFGRKDGEPGESSVPLRWEQASKEERNAAWEAFKALWNAGWRSERPYGPRDELYERDPG